MMNRYMSKYQIKYRGGAEFQPAGIHQYFEDLKRGTNKEIGPKDFFEIASNSNLGGMQAFTIVTIRNSIAEETFGALDVIKQANLFQPGRQQPLLRPVAPWTDISNRPGSAVL
jgi:hypothetical protein